MVSTILTSKPTYHFIGVGGIGMSGLAELLARMGHSVSGSDLAANGITARLETLGVTARPNAKINMGMGRPLCEP